MGCCGSQRLSLRAPASATRILTHAEALKQLPTGTIRPPPPRAGDKPLLLLCRLPPPAARRPPHHLTRIILLACTQSSSAKWRYRRAAPPLPNDGACSRSLPRSLLAYDTATARPTGGVADPSSSVIHAGVAGCVRGGVRGLC